MPKRRLVEHKHRLGYWKGGRQGEPRSFEPVTNFGLQLLRFIAAPSGLPDSYKGYLVRVSQAKKSGQGIREGTCFLPWYKISGVDQLVEILGSALPTSVIQCSVSGRQLRQLLLDLWHDMEQREDSDCGSESEERSSHESSLAVECIGRQCNSDVFVLGPELQFWKSGDPIPPSEQRYVWIPYLLKKLKVLESTDPLQAIPSVKHPIKKLVRGLQRMCGENFGSALFILGGAVMSLFYEGIQKRCGSVAVSIAYGPPSGGKTNAVRLAVAACGNPSGVVAYLSESSARKKLGSSLPFAYDDPSSTEDKFKRMLITAFGGAIQENQQGRVSPKCVPLITANQFVIDALTEDDPRYLARLLLCPFKHSASPVELDTLQTMVDKALGAFPRMLKIGCAIEDISADRLYQIRDHVLAAIGHGTNFDSRLATHYAFAIACTQQIAEASRVSDSETVTQYFEDVITPEIQLRQLEDKSEQKRSLIGLIKELVKSVPATKQYRLLRVINPGIRYRPSKDNRRQIDGVAIVMKEFLALLEKYGIEHQPESILRKQLRGKKDHLTSSKQHFLARDSRLFSISRSHGQVRCSTCICIPRRLLDGATLTMLTSIQLQDEQTEHDREGRDNMELEENVDNMPGTESGEETGPGSEFEVREEPGEEGVTDNSGSERGEENSSDTHTPEVGEEGIDVESKPKDDSDDADIESVEEAHNGYLQNLQQFMPENDNGLPGLKTPTKKDMIRLAISPARNRFRRFASKRLPMYSPIKRGLRLSGSKPVVRRQLRFTQTNSESFLKRLVRSRTCVAKKAPVPLHGSQADDAAVPLAPTLHETAQTVQEKTRKRPGPGRRRRSKRSTRIDENACAICNHAFLEEDVERCVGCDYCPRWFHHDCATDCVVDQLWKCSFH